MTTKTKVPLFKRLLFALVIALVAVGVLELGTRAAVAIFRPEISLADLLNRQANVAEATDEGRRYSQPEVIHPYVGFVIDPTDHQQFNDYGFLQIDGPVLKRSPGTLIVGITGGSVAKDVCEQSSGVLKENLQLAFPDLQPKIVCLAQQGFRQPQQAMTLSFFQCLGAEFDYVVSLDGFNDIALHALEAPKDEIWFAYPRSWDFRVADTSNPRLNQLLHEGHANRVQRKKLAARFQSWKHVPSLPLHLIWNVMDQSYLSKEQDVTFALQKEQLNLANRYANRGPAVHFDTDAERIAAQAELWAACSRQLDRLCRSAQASFVHCLQPNIHIRNSRTPPSANEPHWEPDAFSYHAHVVAGYARLVKIGAELKESGIDFYDLTMLFDDASEYVYSDPCCHFTKHGNDALAASIARQIVSRRQRSAEHQPDN